MFDLLHSFGAGIAFAVGVTVGAVLCRIATKEGRKEIVEDWKAHQIKVEDRLHIYALNSERIAVALEAIAKEKAKNG